MAGLEIALIFGMAFFCTGFILLLWNPKWCCFYNCENENEQQEDMQSESPPNVPNQTLKINMEQMERDLPPSYSDLFGTELTERYFSIYKFMKEYVK